MCWRAAFIASITALLCAAPASAATLTVTTTADPGGSCTGTTCTTLRAAITEAGRLAGTDTINVPAGVISISNDFVIASGIQIIGSSARTTIIDANAKSRAFRVTAEGTLQMANVTVRNGVSGGGDQIDGGGIYNAGTLQLVNVRVTGNRAQAGGTGGGIANNLGLLVADNLLIDNNTADNGAGGIQNFGGQELPSQDGWISLTDTTIFQNSNTSAGGVGGIHSTGTGALLQLSRVTIADNVGGVRGVGGLVPSGNAPVVGSLIARNLVAGDTVNCGGVKPTDSGFNVEDDKDCTLAPGGLKPGLATALSNEGGQLDVLPVTTAGEAFNAVPGTNAACTGSDQRMLIRPKGGACEAGAFELNAGASVTITEGPSGTTTSNDVEFRFQDSGGDVTVQCDLTGPGQTAGFETCYKSNAQPYADLADGPYTFSVRAVSTEFPTPPVSTRSFVVDTAAPVTTITSGPSGLTNDSTPTYAFTANEVGSTFECSIDNATTFTACTAPHTTATLTEGAHTFRVRARDAAGTVGTAVARAITVDTVAPNTTITAGPSGTVASTSATFTYSSEANTTFRCAIDGAALSSCPTGYTGLAQGAHTFQVAAVDAAGNVDQTPAARSWSVDTVAPDTTIGSGPTGAVASTSATFTFTSNEADVSFECALDGAAFGACPVGYTGLAQGSHTFQVRARDAAGTADASPASRTWTVDTTVPDTTITAGPSGATASTSATFTFTSNEGAATFQCSFDGAAFSSCPVGYTGLAQGAHTFQVRAVDAAGNFDASPAARSWTVDTVVPTVTIDASPARTNDTTPSFTFSANEAGATFQCRVDSGTFSPCTSPFTTAALAEGNHTVEVRATDPAGNPGTASRAIVIDLTAPAITVTSGPTGPTNDNTPTYAFTSEAGASFECRVDSAAFAACTSPHTTAQLADGARVFNVRAIDAAGNPSAAAARSITVDTAAPAAPVISTPTENQLLNVGTVNMVGTAEANATVALTAGAASAGSSPVSGTGNWNVVLTPTDGTHTYVARATDAAGNVSATTTRVIRIDTAMPDTSIVSGPSGTTSDTTPTWTFSSTEAGSTFECALDGAAHTACANPFTPTLAAGAHTLSVRAVDPAGNRDNTPATRSITVDTQAPTVTISAGPPARTNDTTPTFTFAADGPATFQCRVDTGALAACTSPHTTAILSEGAHTFEVQAADTAGNIATDTWAFTVDTTRPNTTITGGPPSPGNDPTPEFTFTATEAGSTFECRVGSAAFAACTSPHTTAALPTGGHTLEVRAIDAAGNVDDSPASRSFVIDLTPPGAPSITQAPNTPGSDNTPTFAFTGDAGATFQCRLDSAAFATCVSGLTLPQVGDGAHRFEVRAVDAAGNESGATGFNFVVDTGVPAAPVVVAPTANQWLTASPVTVSGTSEGSAFIEIKAGGVTRGSGTATAGGAWSIAIGVVDGTHTYEVTARDAAANTSTAASRTFRVDTAAPNAPTIAAVASGSTVTLSGSSEAGATVEVFEGAASRGTVVADGDASWSRVLTSVADGSHTYTARARDAAGNLSASSEPRTVVVDTVAPSVTITSGPNGPTNVTAPTFAFTSEAGATFECRVDAGTFAACTSPRTTAPLSPGQHTFEVRARDGAGNTGTASRTFNVDTAPPMVEITAGPAGPTADSTPTFAFTAEADAALACRVDGGGFAACTSPHTTATLAQGDHTFEVRATDAAGNTATATRDFTVDDGAPVAPTVTGPSGPTNDPTPTFTFTGETTNFACTLDGVEIAACASPFTAAALPDGPHTFRVTVTDAVGNVSPATVREFVVDTASPAVAITGGPAAPTADTTPTFTFTGEAGATLTCRVDGAAFAACTSPHTTGALGQGDHTFEVRATDAAGNDATAKRDFAVDDGAPVAPTVNGPSGPTNDPTPTFTFTGETTNFACTLDGVEIPGCASPFTAATLPDGPHTFRVTVTDAVGNRSVATVREFVVDTAPPAAGVTEGPDGATADANPAFVFTAPEARTECRLDGPAAQGEYAACVSPKGFSALAPGGYTFFVRATDPAGNQTETRRAFTITRTQQAQPTPTPTPTPTVVPSQSVVPVPNQVIVVAPKTGTVLVKARGERAFAPLDVTKGIPNGSEVDVRKGRVTLTSIPRPGAPAETADFYGGMFVVTQRGGVTELRLSERLTGCPRGQQATLAQKKPKSRKLWGNGKGSFRTSGKHSAATVRGTIWLVQDTCTTTLTQVTQGVVEVNDFAKKKKVLVKKGKRYTARAKR